MPEFVIIAAQNFVGPEIQFDQNLGVVYHFYTGAKSDLDVYYSDKSGENMIGLGRYGKTYEIDSWDSLIEAVRSGMSGRSYIRDEWAKIFRDQWAKTLG